MSPEQEKQVLLGILQLMQDPAGPKPARSRFLSILAALVIVAAAYYGFRVYEELPLSQMLALLAGAAIGAILAFWVAANFFAERIAVILRVVDVSRIQARLHQLGA